MKLLPDSYEDCIENIKHHTFGCSCGRRSYIYLDEKAEKGILIRVMKCGNCKNKSPVIKSYEAPYIVWNIHILAQKYNMEFNDMIKLIRL